MATQEIGRATGARAHQGLERGWLTHQYGELLGQSATWFTVGAGVTLVSYWLPWLGDARRMRSGWDMFAGWDILLAWSGSSAQLALGLLLLALLGGGWALLRRGPLAAGAVALASTGALTLTLIATADEANGATIFGPGLLIYLLAGAIMLLAAGTAGVLHLLAALLDIAADGTGRAA